MTRMGSGLEGSFKMMAVGLFVGKVCFEGKRGKRKECLSMVTIISIIIAWQ